MDPYPFFTYNVIPGHPNRLDKASGWVVTDKANNSYVDLSSTTLNLALGHRHDSVKEAVKEQLEKIWFGPSYFQHEAFFELSELLVSQAPKGICSVNLRSCNGTDAVDTALKMALLHTRRSKILCLRNSWHGTSLSTLPLSSGHSYHRVNFVPDLEYTDKPTVASLVQLIQRFPKAAAVIFDPVGVSAGVFVLDDIKEDIRRVRELCNKHKIALIFDEIQTFGFMGESMFVSNILEVTPDIICIGKAFGAGLPLSAVLCKEEYRAAVQKNEGEYTHGGQPLTCVAALQSLKTHLSLRGQVLENLAELERLVTKLSLQLPYLTFSRSGFIVGITRKDGAFLKPWVSRAYKLGIEKSIIIRNNFARNIVVKAPIITTPDILEDAFKKLAEVFEECERELLAPSSFYEDLAKSNSNPTLLTRIKKVPPTLDQLDYWSALASYVSSDFSVRMADAKEQEKLCKMLIDLNIPAEELRVCNGGLEHTYKTGVPMDLFLREHASTDPGLVNGLVLEHQRYVETAHDAGISIPNRWPMNALVSSRSLTLMGLDFAYSDASNKMAALFAFEEVFSTFHCVSGICGNLALQQDLAERLCYSLHQRHGHLALALFKELVKFYGSPNKGLTIPEESLSIKDYRNGIEAMKKGFNV